MRAALELLREFQTTGRRIVVTGDMGELGDESETLHRELGKQIVDTAGADLLVACGRFARCVADGALAAGMSRARAIAVASADDASRCLNREILPGDVVLVKGSRMMAMERIVELLARGPNENTPDSCGRQDAGLTKRTIERTPPFVPDLREFGAYPSLLGSEQLPA